MATERRSVFSSYIQNIGYDPETRVLSVGYKSGGETHYQDVSSDTAAAVMSAPSIGSALHEYVRGKHGHTSQMPGKPPVTKPAPQAVPEMAKQMERRR